MKSFVTKYISLLLLCLLGCALSACDSDKEDEARGPEGRTILVYQVADNNLGDYGWDTADIREMQTAAQRGDIGNNRLLVYNSRWTGVYLMEITQSGIDTLKVYPRTPLSVTSRRMTEVLDDMRTYAPAPAGIYGLVLWSHGTGWLQDGIPDEKNQPRRRSFGYERTGEKMNITTLGRTLEDQGLAFVYFDCCLMMSAEVMYELRDCAPYIIGSSTELPNPGMRYDLNMAPMLYADLQGLTAAAKNTYNHYNSCTGEDRSCTMSVVDTSKIPALAEATRAIYERVTDTYPSGYAPQRLEDRPTSSCRYFDMKHYVHALCLDSDGAPRFDGAAALLADYDAAFAGAVVYSAATPRLWDALSLSDVNGLSTCILRSSYDAETNGYNTLSWYTDVASSLKFNF